MGFRAKFPGRCVTCGGPIREGDLIAGTSRSYSHEACLRAAAPAVPAAAPAAAQVIDDDEDRSGARARWLAYEIEHKDDEPFLSPKKTTNGPVGPGGKNAKVE